MKNDKRLKFFILFDYIVIANLLVYLIRPNYITSLMLVYLPPTLLNLYWLKKSRKKILLFALGATILFAPPVELIARVADAWDVLSIFPRFLGTAPIENLIYAAFNFIWPLAFYEYFIDKDTANKISKRWKRLILLYLLVDVNIYTLYFINKDLIGINYWLIGVIFLLIPSLIIYSHNPKLLHKVIRPTLFFAFVFFIHEVISMQLGHWWWPGEFLVTVNLFGTLFPLDDVIIWYVLSTPALIGGYEFFFDDDK